MSCALASSLSWREVWIIASGPSINKFDQARLTGKTVLAVNDAISKISSPEGAALFSCDPPWVSRRIRFLESHRGEKHLVLALETWPGLSRISGAIYYERVNAVTGLSDDLRRVVTGGNGGYAAINVAYLWGAKEIHLVGFDMNPASDAKYWQWIPRFRHMLPQLERSGVRVINHNLNSFVDAFPKEP